MSILVKKDNLFLLNTKNTSYAFCVDAEGIVRYLYWGKKIDYIEDFQVFPWDGEQGYHPNIDKKMEECSSFGMMRYKEGSLKVTFPDGVRDFRYVVKDIQVEKNLLSIVLEDEYYPFRVTLYYRVYEEEDIIEKWRIADNFGSKNIILERFYSAEYSINGTGYKSINCNGTWANEFMAQTDTLDAGKKVYESLRGATAHVACPFFIIHRNATEDTGEVYYGALNYSGNFKIVAEATPYGYLNILAGISDTDFSWTLKKGEQFRTPSVYSGYSSDGFGKMSNTMANFARKEIMPKAEMPLRVLYNSWEATTFNVTEKKQKELADKAAAIGVELYVVDDGWFGQRSSDHLGLGDWYVNPEKFPNGLKPLIDHVNKLGMDFGIWIEPEMVNEDSDLYRAHPDWIYRYPTRKVLEGRYQYMLDLTNPEVLTYIINVIDQLLSSYNISYIKWDMNRALGECGSSYQKPSEYKTIWFKHVQGFYHIIKTLKEKHPNVEFEACASGGGRVDFGCMHYFDEFWTSDNTDALDRLSIQETYSLIYPIKYMRAWVTDAGSKGGRRIPLSFRIHCAMCGALGIGMNLNLVTDEEYQALKKAIELYKELRDTIQFGTLYRLKSYQRDDFHAVQYTRGQKTVLFTFLVRRVNGKPDCQVKLRGLDKEKKYRFTVDGKEYLKSGIYLMNFGLNLLMMDDYSSKCVVFEEMIGENEVNCFGDSLTFSYGGNGITYPGTLQMLLGNRYMVNNMGIGGENTTTIAGRQGSIPMHVKEVTIPAKVKTVEVEFLPEQGAIPKPLRQGEAGINPCYMNGIKGDLSITQSTTTSEDAKWYFIREETETEVHIKKAEELITQASLYHRNGIIVLWTGTNDKLEFPVGKFAEQLIEKQKVMINYLKETDKKYIVIGLTHIKDYTSSMIDSINMELEKAYGNHFLNIKKYLLEEGIQASGLQETDQDRIDIRQGDVPQDLRIDEVHLNAAGYTLVGQQVYMKGKELGYW